MLINQILKRRHPNSLVNAFSYTELPNASFAIFRTPPWIAHVWSFKIIGCLLFSRSSELHTLGSGEITNIVKCLNLTTKCLGG